MSNVDRAADILAAAGAYCGECCFGECGEPDCPRTTDWRTCPDCASVVNGYARALAAAGVLAPDLPEPDVTSANNTPVWRADGTNPVTVTDGLTPVRMWILDHAEYVYTPYAARVQANALRAAAEYAEKENNNE